MTNGDWIALFRLIAVALSYPDGQFVHRVQEAIGEVRVDLARDEPRLTLAALSRDLGRLALLPLDQVQGEYTRLFISAYPRVPCPPYESVYTEGELFGLAAEDTDDLYRRWGLVADAEATDHAGAELEFMAFLLALDSPESHAAANQFLAEHIMIWLPQFASDLAKQSRLRFYQAVGALLAAALECRRLVA